MPRNGYPGGSRSWRILGGCRWRPPLSWHGEVAAAMVAPQLPPSHWTTSSCQSTALPAHRPTISSIGIMGAKSGPRTPVSGPSPGSAAGLWSPKRVCSSRHMAHGSQGPYLWYCPLCPTDVYRHGIQWIASDAWSPAQVGTMGFHWRSFGKTIPPCKTDLWCYIVADLVEGSSVHDLFFQNHAQMKIRGQQLSGRLLGVVTPEVRVESVSPTFCPMIEAHAVWSGRARHSYGHLLFTDIEEGTYQIEQLQITNPEVIPHGMRCAGPVMGKFWPPWPLQAHAQHAGTGCWGRVQQLTHGPNWGKRHQRRPGCELQQVLIDMVPTPGMGNVEGGSTIRALLTEFYGSSTHAHLSLGHGVAPAWRLSLWQTTATPPAVGQCRAGTTTRPWSTRFGQMSRINIKPNCRLSCHSNPAFVCADCIVSAECTRVFCFVCLVWFALISGPL